MGNRCATNGRGRHTSFSVLRCTSIISTSNKESSPSIHLDKSEKLCWICVTCVARFSDIGIFEKYYLFQRKVVLSSTECFSGKKEVKVKGRRSSLGKEVMVPNHVGINVHARENDRWVHFQSRKLKSCGSSRGAYVQRVDLLKRCGMWHIKELNSSRICFFLKEQS